MGKFKEKEKKEIRRKISVRPNQFAEHQQDKSKEFHGFGREKKGQRCFAGVFLLTYV